MGWDLPYARVLSESGYRVALTDLTEGLVRAAAEELDSDLVLPIVCDVTDRKTVETAVAQFAEWADGIDVLVSNAGLIHSNESLADTDDDFFGTAPSRSTSTVLSSTSRACLPWLERSGTGRMIFVSSIWGQSGIGHSYAYCAAKVRHPAFSKNAARAGAKGISVNSVAPGGVHTAMTAEFSEAELDEDYKSIPLGRYAEPEEISHLIRYLASPESGFLTGQTISINGGQVIGGF